MSFANCEIPPDRVDPPPGGLAPGYNRPGLRQGFRIHLTFYVLVNLLLIGIWAASGGGYFWPIWPILGWGMGIAGHAAPIIAGVGRRSRRAPAGPRRARARAGARRTPRSATSPPRSAPSARACARQRHRTAR